MKPYTVEGLFMKSLQPETPKPDILPKGPEPNDALTEANRQTDLMRRRRGRSGTILSDETRSGVGGGNPFKTFLGE
jgi:hypothetical protein